MQSLTPYSSGIGGETRLLSLAVSRDFTRAHLLALVKKTKRHSRADVGDAQNLVTREGLDQIHPKDLGSPINRSRATTKGTKVGRNGSNGMTPHITSRNRTFDARVSATQATPGRLARRIYGLPFFTVTISNDVKCQVSCHTKSYQVTIRNIHFSSGGENHDCPATESTVEKQCRKQKPEKTSARPAGKRRARVRTCRFLSDRAPEVNLPETAGGLVVNPFAALKSQHLFAQNEKLECTVSIGVPR